MKKQKTIPLIDISILAHKRILTVPELSAYTGLSMSWIYKLCQQGLLPHSRPNSKLIYFDREKVEGWLLSNPVEPIPGIEQLADEYLANHSLKGGNQ